GASAVSLRVIEEVLLELIEDDTHRSAKLVPDSQKELVERKRRVELPGVRPAAATVSRHRAFSAERAAAPCHSRKTTTAAFARSPGRTPASSTDVLPTPVAP